jgi:hypothetical protein
MIEQDTIKLLRECDAGIKMGVKSIDDVENFVESSEMKSLLQNARRIMRSSKTSLKYCLMHTVTTAKSPTL